MIKIVFVPDENFVFPKTKRCFRFDQFKKFPWLCYSPSEDAAYCLSCVSFGYKDPGMTSRVKNLDSRPFRDWPAAASVFKIHVPDKKRKMK